MAKPKKRTTKTDCKELERIDPSALTDRQRAFADFYVQIFDATKAARLAGYKDNEYLHTHASKMLQNATIRAMVEARLRHYQMSAEEVLARLSAHARGDLSPFLDSSGAFDLTTDQAKANMFLVKKTKVRQRRGVGKNGNDEWEEIESEIELHDPQAALVHLGRYHKLFTDKIETNDATGLTDDQRAERIISIIEQARARGSGSPPSGDDIAS
jgi:phage terminase small subunit